MKERMKGRQGEMNEKKNEDAETPAGSGLKKKIYKARRRVGKGEGVWRERTDPAVPLLSSSQSV